MSNFKKKTDTLAIVVNTTDCQENKWKERDRESVNIYFGHTTFVTGPVSE